MGTGAPRRPILQGVLVDARGPSIPCMDDHRGPTFFDWITDLLVSGMIFALLLIVVTHSLGWWA